MAKTFDNSTPEERKKYLLVLAQRDVDEALRLLLEAENDVREAQSRVVEETDMYERACAVYADVLSGRRSE